MEKKVEKALIKIFRQKIWINLSNRLPGFSLIEMLIVIGIIAMISTIAVPSVSSYFQLSLNSATRDLATTIKEAYNSAIVTGKTHRVAYEFKSNLYWVESGPSLVLLDSLHDRNLEPHATKKEVFALEKSVTRKKVPLPRGVIYEDVLTQQSSTPVSEGIAYTHFFPNGMTEQTLIHLKDQSTHHATLVIASLVGSTDVYDRYVGKEEVFGK